MNESECNKAIDHLEKIIPGFGDLLVPNIIAELEAKGKVGDIHRQYNNPLRTLVSHLSKTGNHYSNDDADAHQYGVGQSLEEMITTDALWYVNVYKWGHSDDPVVPIAKRIIEGVANGNELVCFLSEIHCLKGWMKATFLSDFLQSIQGRYQA